MAILVTGGAGYIGSHCVARLIERGGRRGGGGRPVQGPPGGPQGRPPLCGQRGRPGLPGRCIFQGAHRGGHPLRRLLPGGREYAGARAVFPQQRHCRADPHRDHARPQGALSGVLLHRRHLRRAGVCAHRRGPPSEPHQPLRREQAHRGEDAQVVRPGPRPQVLQPCATSTWPGPGTTAPSARITGRRAT